ncbi:hypothetical protein B9Z55_021583 [Caenorhabditis nigoni]|nr:hypothetical protein B9Z55_021583 [Caenorhabditis nigoni]
MPISLLSLPAKDLQYAINSMDVSDLLAFSLCSKRTKNLVKSSNLQILRICAEVDENRIYLGMFVFQFRGNFQINIEKTIRIGLCEDFSIAFEREDGFQMWKNTEFTFSYLIAHFLSLSNISTLLRLQINNMVPIGYLDTVKQQFSKCQILEISEGCSEELTKMVFLKLAPLAGQVEVGNNPRDVSNLLTLNLSTVLFKDMRHPLELKLDDLLNLNIYDLCVRNTVISANELNRFLQLWMSNHGFYRPMMINLRSDNGWDSEKVMKGIKYDNVDKEPSFRLKREDGKELKVANIGPAISTAQLMPISLLSLPIADLQYALNCMDVSDLIAFSLCSKRTKNLVKSSNREIESISAKVDENRVRICIMAEIYREDANTRYYRNVVFKLFDSYIELHRNCGIEVWRKQEFTQSHWIAHILSIFDKSMIEELQICQACPIPYLDTVKKIILKCQKLEIRDRCPNDFAKIAISKLSSLAVEMVEINKNIFDDENDISKFLTLNLTSVSLCDHETPFKLKLEDLLTTNIAKLIIRTAIITEKELNRFVKLWIKGSQRFCRLEYIRLHLEDGIEMNRQEVFKGVKYQVTEDLGNLFALTRQDGKELRGSIEGTLILLLFR